MKSGLEQLRSATFFTVDEITSRFLGRDVLAGQEKGPHSRRRVFSLARTLSSFLFQCLNPGMSCREVVRQVQAACCQTGTRQISSATTSFCNARSALPEDRCWKALEATARHASRNAARLAPGRLAGRRVIVADASSTQLPDTPANQSEYPQPSVQKPGCGFPVMPFLALFCLATGAILRVLVGKGSPHDLNMIWQLRDAFQRDDILLGDRAYCSWSLMAMLRGRGADIVTRLHQSRSRDMRRGRRLGKGDRLQTWKKRFQKPEYISQEEWEAMPDEMEVRVVRCRFEIKGMRTREIWVATTLTDAKKYPASQLAELYRQRWQLEVTLRDVKTTMGMEALRCQEPSRARKELLMYFCAHNVVRGIMAQSAIEHGCKVFDLSFKGSLDAFRQFGQARDRAGNARKRAGVLAELLKVIASDPLCKRPGRSEPRARKRRPKNYPLLTRPRRTFKVLQKAAKAKESATKKAETELKS